MTKEMEDREWLNDYTALKQVAKNNPFTVPVGYFEELGERITATIRLNELKAKMPLDGFTLPENYFEELNNNIQSRVNIEKAAGADTGFTLPENYFEELNGNIQSRIFIEEALNTAHTGFTVPENYFEELNSNIQSRIFIEEALNTEHTGFTVPENYFEELNSQITSRIFVEEALATTAETLTVPQDYFNQLNKKILNKTVNQDIVKRKARVIKMFSTTAFKYATAACLMLMVGAGVVLEQAFSPEAVHKRSFLHKELSNVSTDEIQSYLELNADDTQHTLTNDADASQADDAELDAALQQYANDPQK